MVETEKFCCIFDKFFDCLNTRNLKEAQLKRKPDLRGYFSPKDTRINVGHMQQHNYTLCAISDIDYNYNNNYA